MDILLILIPLLLYVVSICCLFKSIKTNHFLFIVVLIFISNCFYFFKYTVDDAYISLRYAENFVNGYGLTYDSDGVSQPVEAYTNFSWIILNSVFFILPIQPEHVIVFTKFLGIPFGLVTLLFLYKLIKIRSSLKTAQIMILLYAATPMFAIWSVAGLETSLFLSLMMLALYLVSRCDVNNVKNNLITNVVLLGLAFTRPEGVLLAMAALVYLFIKWVKTKNRSTAFLFNTSILIFLYGAYTYWRINYYGYLLPNSFYAKVPSVLLIQLIQRIEFLLPIMVVFSPLLIVAFYALVKKSWETKYLEVSFLIVGFSFMLLPKVEWMIGFRYELPFLIMIMYLAGLGMDGFRKSNKIFTINKTVIFIGILFILGLVLRRDIDSVQHMNRAHIALGKWLNEYVPEATSYASWDLGAVAYYSKIPTIIELHPEGLLSNIITHQGYSVDKLIQQNPSIVILPDRIPVPEGHYRRLLYQFYDNAQFQGNYEYLFTIHFLNNYDLVVFKNINLVLSKEAALVGQETARKSFLE